ncbi:MAG: DUF58 domain-containing protein [Chloroflexota bacterium]|nr:DUF58 domain-containing protein [Chloroflexota bacterium]
MRRSLVDTIARPFQARSPVDGHHRGVATDEPLFDEAVLGRLRRLALVSGRARTEGIAGEHRSRRRGTSPEFADFKSYSQGDDYRRIDWNTFGRLDELFVRVSEVTTELSLHILLDASASMDWSGEAGAPSKFTYARRLAGALGYIGLWHGDRLTIAPFADELAAPFGPVQGRAQIMPMLRHLEATPPLGGTALAGSIERYVTARRRPGLMIIVSDLLAGDPDELRAILRSLRTRRWEVTIVHVLGEAEVTPAVTRRYLAGVDANRAPVELVETESAARLRLTPTDEVLDRYEAAINGWLEQIEEICQAERTKYARLLTCWDMESVVLGVLHRRGVVA